MQLYILYSRINETFISAKYIFLHSITSFKPSSSFLFWQPSLPLFSSHMGDSSSDGTNPFYLHHSDHPNLVFVSTKKLRGDNYTACAHGMQISLSAKNKLGFIEGNAKEPSSSEDPDAHAAWRRCNDMILSWILHSMEPDFKESVFFFTCAKAIWDNLRDRFSQSNASRIFQVNCHLATISQVSSPVSAYFTCLKGL